MSGKICAHPGCERPLSGDNTSGVCREHNHTDFCGCIRCAGKRAPQAKVARAEPVQREGVRVCEVSTYSGVSTARGLNRVSLPVEPWRRG